MKKIKSMLAVAIAALAMTFSSCGKDYEDLIVGSWEMTKMVATMTYSGFPDEYDVNGTQTETITPEDGQSLTMTFSADGNVTIVSVDPEDGTETTNGTYTIKDDQLTIAGGELTGVYTIDNLDKSNMTLSNHQEMSEQLEGQTATMSVDVKMELKKK